jgi:3-deoxy-D-manno-octulosonic-acid transferase
MGHSLGLAAYLALAERGKGYAVRQGGRAKATEALTDQRLAEHLGDIATPRPLGTLIWFHSQNVSQSLAILELVRRLEDMDEDLRFLFTTDSMDSADLIESRMPARALHQYAPPEARPIIRAFLAHWKPDLAVWTDCELRPALVFETHAAGIPLLLLNARMGRATYLKWRWFPGVARSLLTRFEHALAQDDQTAYYLKRLGYPAKQIAVTGPLKEGSAALPHDEGERTRFAARLAGRPVWLAALTHEHEEKLVAAAHQQAARSAQRLLLIIAPQQPWRGLDIAEKLAAEGWEVAIRSKGQMPEAATQIYIADIPGEMGLWYRIAPVSFVGGSLVEGGGHNPFEPAALGSAVIHGPHIEKVADIYARLAEAGAAVEVKSVADLVKAVGRVLAPDRAAAMAHAAWEVSSRGAEVTDRALDLLQGYLPDADYRVA